MDKKLIEIEEIIENIKKRYILVILIILFFGLLGYFSAFVKSNVSYSATVKIFSGKSEKNSAENYTTADITSNVVLMDTYIELIKTDNFMKKIVKLSGVNVSEAELKQGVSFSSKNEVPILTIAYTSTNKDTCKKVIETISTEFEKEVKETILNINTKVIEDVKIIKNEPNKMGILLFFMFLGVGVALFFVFLLDYFDNTLKNKKELEKLLDIPVIGDLPIEKELEGV